MLTIRPPGPAHTAVFCAQRVMTFAYAHSFLFSDLARRRATALVSAIFGQPSRNRVNMRVSA